MNTFCLFPGHFDFSTVCDDNLNSWLVTSALGNILDFVDKIVSFENFAEDNVTSIEPGCDGGGDEELAELVSRSFSAHWEPYLRSIGILSGIGHAQLALLGVLELEVLIYEMIA